MANGATFQKLQTWKLVALMLMCLVSHQVDAASPIIALIFFRDETSRRRTFKALKSYVSMPDMKVDMIRVTYCNLFVLAGAFPTKKLYI